MRRRHRAALLAQLYSSTQAAPVNHCAEAAPLASSGGAGWGGTYPAVVPLTCRPGRYYSPAALRLAEQAIKGNLLFETLSLPARQAIIGSMTPMVARAGDEIIRQVSRSCSAVVVTVGWGFLVACTFTHSRTCSTC